MTNAEVKEARAMLQPFVKRIEVASTGRETVTGRTPFPYSNRIYTQDHYDFQRAIIAHLGGGKTKMFCSMAAVRAWVEQQQEKGVHADAHGD